MHPVKQKDLTELIMYPSTSYVFHIIRCYLTEQQGPLIENLHNLCSNTAQRQTFPVPQNSSPNDLVYGLMILGFVIFTSRRYSRGIRWERLHCLLKLDSELFSMLGFTIGAGVWGGRGEKVDETYLDHDSGPPTEMLFLVSDYP